MTPYLDLTGVYDFDAQSRRLVQYVGALLKAGEAQRVREIMVVLKPFNRSAHDAVLNAYAIHINAIMAAPITAVHINAIIDQQ
jgi:hypothetical protein